MCTGADASAGAGEGSAAGMLAFFFHLDSAETAVVAAAISIGFSSVHCKKSQIDKIIIKPHHR